MRHVLAWPPGMSGEKMRGKVMAMQVILSSKKSSKQVQQWQGALFIVARGWRTIKGGWEAINS